MGVRPPPSAKEIKRQRQRRYVLEKLNEKVKQCIKEYDEGSDILCIKNALNETYANSLNDVNIIIGQYLEQRHQKFLFLIANLLKNKWHSIFNFENIYNRSTYDKKAYSKLCSKVQNNNYYYIEKSYVEKVINLYDMSSQNWICSDSDPDMKLLGIK